jgi:hypothetical protein
MALSALLLQAGAALASEPQSAVITFSGLWNGVSPYTDVTDLHRPMPSTYQPLVASEQHTKPSDGGNLGIQIVWEHLYTSNHGLNGNVKDHTGDALIVSETPHHEVGGGVMFALGPSSMIFSKPVEIPSLYWTFYEAPTQPVLSVGTISVFRNVKDQTPLKSVEVPYNESHGYVWFRLAGFAGLKISKIVFDPRGQGTGLNIDDITVRVSN